MHPAFLRGFVKAAVEHRNIVKELGLDVSRPSDLYMLLNAAMLSGAMIRAGNAMRASRALKDYGFTSPDRVLDTTWNQRVRLLNQHGYARYDESRARFLEHNAKLVKEKYQGDLRKMVEGKSPSEIKRLVQEFKGIGPVGARIFLREFNR